MIRGLAGARERRQFTVDEVTLRVKNLIDYDEVLADLVVEGDLTEFKRHVSGHIYFTLKGQNATLACVMFRSDVGGQLFWPQIGDRVAVTGSVRLYEARGAVQLYARKMMPLGVGAAARAKEELRASLQKEGLFAQERKRPIPSHPAVVACVTSATGAAVRDVIRQFYNRSPHLELVVVPCLVQGETAASSAVQALRRAIMVPGVEVILLVRGGGAKEDLNPFDDEDLVRELARSPVPVVTGIGHEIDESLCDLVADRREPTPTAAAVSVFPDSAAQAEFLSQCQTRLNRNVLSVLESSRHELDLTYGELNRTASQRIAGEQQRLDMCGDKMTYIFSDHVRQGSSKLNELERSLGNLSPYSLCKRGYSLVLYKGKPLVKAAAVSNGESLTVQLLDGDIYSTVDSVLTRN